MMCCSSVPIILFLEVAIVNETEELLKAIDEVGACIERSYDQESDYYDLTVDHENTNALYKAVDHLCNDLRGAKCPPDVLPCFFEDLLASANRMLKMMLDWPMAAHLEFNHDLRTLTEADRGSDFADKLSIELYGWAENDYEETEKWAKRFMEDYKVWKHELAANRKVS